MQYDFDTVYDRSGTHSLKYKSHPHYPNETLIPLWVADMDFKTAPEIIDALRKATEHGIFGYTVPDEAYFNSLLCWNQKRFHFDVKEEWVTPCEGVMSGIAAALSALSAEGDAVLIFQPVYHLFDHVLRDNKRRIIVSELQYDGKKYVIDYDDFERKVIENDVKILLFCSPHNPVGRVWSREELARVTAICLQHNVLIISDEIHSDLTFQPHIPTASLSDAVADITVALTSVTKTFNLAGIQGANLIIPNGKIRALVEARLRAQCSGGPGIMSLAAAKAAYQHGENWLDALLGYLQGNIDYVILSFAGTKIKPIIPQGTYLMWLDCRNLGLCDKELEEFFIKKCGVWMNSGYIFGKGGSGFMRMNVACPRATLEKAVHAILQNTESNWR